MLEERRVLFAESVALLKQCGLNPVDCADYRMGIFAGQDRMVATGALVGDMLQMIAVDPDYQGHDLATRVVSHLLNYAAAQDIFCLYLFTKSDGAFSFESMGFRMVAHVRDMVALLEWGAPGIDTYCEGLRALKLPDASTVGSLVMNCNPFTLGHQYLIEQAAARCDQVIVLAVEEDVSEFPFPVRLELMRRGTAHLGNVTVVRGGRYVISSLTFPAYFSRDAVRSFMESRIDAEIFASRITPALGITDRFLGEEPFSPSTAIYNEVVRERLSQAGVRVSVLPRLEASGGPISASGVREHLKRGDLAALEELLPETTLAYIKENLTQVRRWVCWHGMPEHA